MKKIFLVIAFFVAVLPAKAQSPFPIKQTIGSPSTLVTGRGGLSADSALILPVFVDTTAANRGNWPRYYPGNLIRCGDDIWMRNQTATMWIKITNGGAHTHVFADITDGVVAVRNLFFSGTGISYNSATGVISATGNGTANIYNLDSTLATNRVVYGSNDSRGLTFDSLNYFNVNRSGITGRIYMNNMSSGIFSPDGQISEQVSNVVAQMNAGAGNNVIYAYTDSTALSNPNGRYRFGNLKYQNDTSLYKPVVAAGDGEIFTSSWIGAGGGGLDSVAVLSSPLIDSMYQYTGGDSTLVHLFDHNCGLVQPGLVTHDSLLIFTVSPSVEISCCDGIRRTYPETNITLSAADGTYPRYDAIVLDQATNTVIKITGMASSDPVLPQPGDCQTILTYIYVPALATTPGNYQSVTIYDENAGAPAEWPGVATSVSVNFGDEASPYHLSTDASAGAVTASSRIDFTSTDSVKITNFSVLNFYIKLKASFATNTKFVISFWNNGVQRSTGVTVQHGTYGFNRTLIGTYEKISIPITDFGFFADTVDAMRIQLTGSNASGFYIDWITLQGGINQPSGTASSSGQRFAVEDNVQKENRYFNGKNFGYFNIDSIKSLVMSFNPAGGFRVKDFTTALPNNDIIRYNSSEYSLDPLSTSMPMYLKNLPQSDTATYIVGITTGNRLLRQTKSGVGNIYTINGVLTGNRKLSGTNTYYLELDSLTRGLMRSYYPADTTQYLLSVNGTAHTAQMSAATSSSRYTAAIYTQIPTSVSSETGLYAKSSTMDNFPEIKLTSIDSTVTIYGYTTLFHIDTAGSTHGIFIDNLPQSNFAGKFILTVDSVTKRVEKTSASLLGGGSTPTLQQVFNTEIGGSVLTKQDSIQTGANRIKIFGDNVPFQVITGTSNGPQFINNGTGTAFSATGKTGAFITNESSTTNTVTDGLYLTASPAGNGAPGLGTRLIYYLKTGSLGTKIFGDISGIITDTTHTFESGKIQINTIQSGQGITSATFNGSGILMSNGVMPTSGSGGTDSVIRRNSSTGQLYLSAIGSTPTLQQVTTAGNTSTNEISVTTTSGESYYGENNGTSPIFRSVTYGPTTNAAIVIRKEEIQTSGTATVGLGAIEDLYIESSSGALPNAVRITKSWTNATNGATEAQYLMQLQSAGILTSRFSVLGNGSVLTGLGNARATNATDGFLYIPTCAGTPSGVPTTQSGMVALIWDSTNHKLYVYDNGVWNAMN